MSKLIHDIVALGAGLGEFTRLDYGMDECDWRAGAGNSRGYVAGWWEGKAGSVEFPATESDEAVWLVEGNRREFSAGQGYLLPAGFAGRWETIEDAKKFYVLLEQA